MQKIEHSRKIFYKDTKQQYGLNPWFAEISRVRKLGIKNYGTRPLLSWKPLGPNAHANCPMLDSNISEIKELVPSRWKHRVDSVYAGRGKLELFTDSYAHSHRETGGAYIYISFPYMYAIMGSYITLGDFCAFADELPKGTVNPLIEEELKSEIYKSFQLVRSGDYSESKIFFAKTRAKADEYARIQQLAELWVLCHELAHLIIKDEGSRPDRGIQAEIDAILDSREIAPEIAQLRQSHPSHFPVWLDEFRADVLGALILAGHFNGPTGITTDFQSFQGAAAALLAVGLLENDWTHSASHPSPLSRLAVLSQLFSKRFRECQEGTLTMREELVRTIALALNYANWISRTPLEGDRAQSGGNLELYASLKSSFVMLSTQLFVSSNHAIFDPDLTHS